MNLIRKLAVLMVVITILIVLLPTWYWALFGMADTVVRAWNVTALISMICSFGLFMVEPELPSENEGSK